MFKKKTIAAVLIAVLANATGAFAQAPDPLDPLLNVGSRFDDLSPYPGPRLTTPDPLYPSRQEGTTREGKAPKLLLKAVAKPVLKTIPGTSPFIYGYKAYE